MGSLRENVAVAGKLPATAGSQPALPQSKMRPLLGRHTVKVAKVAF